MNENKIPQIQQSPETVEARKITSSSQSEIPIRTWRWLGVNKIDNLPDEIREIRVPADETISLVDKKSSTDRIVRYFGRKKNRLINLKLEGAR